MTKAIEKLVHDEIRGDEKAELVHDLAVNNIILLHKFYHL